MKKLLVILVSFLLITLASCVPQPTEEYEYSDFEDHLISTYNEAENLQNNKYIVYYYSQNCGHCQTVKQDVLGFFDSFEMLPFYIFDISSAVFGTSGLDEFIGTPTIFIMSDNQVSEAYIGSVNIITFIEKYKNIELDYSSFESLQLTTYQDVLEIENDAYILYYYLDNCPHCMLVKDDFLKWAFTKSVGDIYLMNGANVIDPDNIPTELTILHSGTPIIVVMSNGEFADEYYSGSDEILQYILDNGTDPITAPNYTSNSIDDTDLDDDPQEEDPQDVVVTYDYNDFSNQTITKFVHSLTISNNPHLVYYYHPSCAYCNSIKQDVLTFFNDLDNFEFFLLDTTIATDDLNIQELTTVPSLFLIVNNDVEITYIGTQQILGFIDDYTNGLVNFDDY